MNQRDSQRLIFGREELAERIANTLPNGGSVEVLPGVTCNRASTPTDKVHGVSRPSLCVIAQGAKEVYLGESCLRYDPGNYLLATVELPITGQVVEASVDRPYLSLRIDLDPNIVGSVMVEAGVPAASGQSSARALTVSSLEADLLDATLRLIRLIGNPTESRVVAPLVTREIIFRLLMGEQGNRLRHLPTAFGNSNVITHAIERLRKEFDQPLRMDDVARQIGMSSSGFHHHFRAVTGMSPLQFQKQVRLQEARRLMFGESMDAASAGYQVGYEDAAHFNREYKRLFGMPPIRDVERLRRSLTPTKTSESLAGMI